MPEKLLYRKRFIPMETIALKDDKILLWQDDLIVTKWNSLKPRRDIGSGLLLLKRRHQSQQNL